VWLFTEKKLLFWRVRLKKILLVLFCGLVFMAGNVKAEMSINFQNNFGVTAVDVWTAMEIPETSDTTWLNDFDQFNYKGLIQLMFEDYENERISYGVELGVHRLYFWEEKYKPEGLDARWTGGTVWTGSVSVLGAFEFANDVFIMSGLSVHSFFNGSGLTIGIPFALRYEWVLADKWRLPLEIRADWVFGNDTPLGVGAGFGLKYLL
jgi:hypothetical protein